MTDVRTLGSRPWTLGALAFAVGYELLRFYWAVGGRWGYTACDRTNGVEEISTGCGAEHLATPPFWQGWGAVALSGALVASAVMAALRAGRFAVFGAWGASAALVVLAFPLHLLFEIPAAVSGRPTDWRDIVSRLLLLGGGLLFAAAAAEIGPRHCAHPRADGPQPVPAWVHWWAYAGVAVPILGWTVPHGLWALGVPFGISADELAEISQEIDPPLAVAIVAVPALGGLLTLGLAQRWGQIFPRWTPWLAGRRVPRPLALVPASIVAVALTCYGLISIGVMTAALLGGELTWSQLRSGWAVAATLPVFLAWGVALGITTLGYHLVTRPRCDACRRSAETTPSRNGPPVPRLSEFVARNDV
jgi:hypothetical protein